MKRTFLLLLIVCCFSVSAAFADGTPIGNGFTCQGTDVFKGTKEVKVTSAKSTLAKTIEKLKEQLGNAPKKKKKGIQDKITAARDAKNKIGLCAKGLLAPDQVDPIFTSLASGSGVYLGNYSGTVSGFIPVTGTIKMSFKLEGTVFSADMEVGGNVGNTLNFQPLGFTNDVGGIGFPAIFTISNTFIGDVTLNITQDGQVTITNSNSTKGTITFSGKFANTSITGSLGGTYSGVPFDGTCTLDRQA